MEYRLVSMSDATKSSEAATARIYRAPCGSAAEDLLRNAVEGVAGVLHDLGGGLRRLLDGAVDLLDRRADVHGARRGAGAAELHGGDLDAHRGARAAGAAGRRRAGRAAGR